MLLRFGCCGTVATSHRCEPSPREREYTRTGRKRVSGRTLKSGDRTKCGTKCRTKTKACLEIGHRGFLVGAGTARPRDFLMPNKCGDEPSPPLGSFQTDSKCERVYATFWRWER